MSILKGAIASPPSVHPAAISTGKSQRNEMQKYLRPRQVAARYGVSIATVWRWANDERYQHLEFPRACPLGDKVSAWAIDELDEFDERRKALRDAAA